MALRNSRTWQAPAPARLQCLEGKDGMTTTAESFQQVHLLQNLRHSFGSQKLQDKEDVLQSCAISQISPVSISGVTVYTSHTNSVSFSAVAPLRVAPSSLCPSALREVPTVPAPPKVEGDSTDRE